MLAANKAIYGLFLVIIYKGLRFVKMIYLDLKLSYVFTKKISYWTYGQNMDLRHLAIFRPSFMVFLLFFDYENVHEAYVQYIKRSRNFSSFQNAKASISEKLDLKPLYSEVASYPQMIQMIKFNCFVLIFQNR